MEDFDLPLVLECSSKGNIRYSAFYAKLSDGRSIECHYQCDIKGYDPGGTNWKLGKGKPPLDLSVDTRTAYDNLWREYLKLNPHLKQELLELKNDGVVFNDMFAHGRIPNQAETLYRICSE